MPNFKCAKCGCLENTATSNYWIRKKGAPQLCSECDTEIGKWHDKFDKQLPPHGSKLCSDGFVYSQEEIESGHFKWRMKFAGLKIIEESK